MAKSGNNKKQNIRQSAHQQAPLDAPPTMKSDDNLAQNLLNMGIGVLSVIIMALIVIAMIQFVG